jgi:hypothetical protein
MFNTTERQIQLSHFIIELKNNIAEKCDNVTPELTEAEMEYVYAALVSSLINNVTRWTYEDLGEGDKDENFSS